MYILYCDPRRHVSLSALLVEWEFHLLGYTLLPRRELSTLDETIPVHLFVLLWRLCDPATVTIWFQWTSVSVLVLRYLHDRALQFLGGLTPGCWLWMFYENQHREVSVSICSCRLDQEYLGCYLHFQGLKYIYTADRRATQFFQLVYFWPGMVEGLRYI